MRKSRRSGRLRDRGSARAALLVGLAAAAIVSVAAIFVARSPGCARPAPVPASPSAATPYADLPASGSSTGVLLDLAAAPPGGLSSWVDLAKRGDREAALDLVREDVPSVLNEADQVDLLLLAETARLEGDTALAREAYLGVRRRFDGSKYAARAAFQLGRLAAEQPDPEAAARWFETYLDESPQGAFAREAEGRLMKARLAAGDTEGARAIARDYLDRWADGPHAPLAHSLLRTAGE